MGGQGVSQPSPALNLPPHFLSLSLLTFSSLLIFVKSEGSPSPSQSLGPVLAPGTQGKRRESGQAVAGPSRTPLCVCLRGPWIRAARAFAKCWLLAAWSGSLHEFYCLLFRLMQCSPLWGGPCVRLKFKRVFLHIPFPLVSPTLTVAASSFSYLSLFPLLFLSLPSLLFPISSPIIFCLSSSLRCSSPFSFAFPVPFWPPAWRSSRCPRWWPPCPSARC